MTIGYDRKSVLLIPRRPNKNRFHFECFLRLVGQDESFPGGSDGKASACNAGDLGSIPVLGRSPGEGNGNPLQYSCLENPTDGGTWWATGL